jgi:hypothetical protein
MGDWTKVGENLQRHVGGTIYLRAKVKGKVIRVSLGTKDLRIAKLKRDAKLATFRAEALVKNPQGGSLRTIREALAVLRSEVLAQPHLKKPTRDYYTHIFKILGETLPVDYLGRTWTKGEAVRWWQDIAGKHSPILANNILSMVRKLGWDYVWIAYIPVMAFNDNGVPCAHVLKPTSAHVERVYCLCDFNMLQINNCPIALG